MKQYQDQDYTRIGEGYFNPSPNEKIYQTKDTITGRRRVKVCDQPATWVYTKCKTDREAIDKYNKRIERMNNSPINRPNYV